MACRSSPGAQLSRDGRTGTVALTPSIAISPGPAAGGEDHGVSGQPSAIGFNHHIAVALRDPTDFAALDHLRATPARGCTERARQIAGGDEAVRLDQQAADRAIAKLGFLRSGPRARRPAMPANRAARAGQRSPSAPAFPGRSPRYPGCRCGDQHGHPALRGDALHERIEQGKAAHREVEERVACALRCTAPARRPNAWVAPMPTGRGSTIRTDAPRRASSCAMAHPTIPAPTTMMSEGRPMKSQLSRGRHRRNRARELTKGTEERINRRSGLTESSARQLAGAAGPARGAGLVARCNPRALARLSVAPLLRVIPLPPYPLLPSSGPFGEPNHASSTHLRTGGLEPGVSPSQQGERVVAPRVVAESPGMLQSWHSGSMARAAFAHVASPELKPETLTHLQTGDDPPKEE